VATRDRPPCWVCGRRAAYVHGTLHYCTDNACQLVAAGSWTLQQARADLEGRGVQLRIDQGCPLCYAQPDEACVTPAGTPRNDHMARTRAANPPQEAA
jgi:hypothetical protein